MIFVYRCESILKHSRVLGLCCFMLSIQRHCRHLMVNIENYKFWNHKLMCLQIACKLKNYFWQKTADNEECEGGEKLNRRQRSFLIFVIHLWFYYEFPQLKFLEDVSLFPTYHNWIEIHLRKLFCLVLHQTIVRRSMFNDVQVHRPTRNFLDFNIWFDMPIYSEAHWRPSLASYEI